ncbi:CcdC family protein [Alkalibacillus salilacus]|uniref:Membrane protein CcdC involved in cytochrome C biogenesis n=1 Tax=Alkalibacillus salilacus TaxID=284582 RepID=A0ABT9VD87_9BACI|nr:cytochrome c biogenesis protein CcdC [Alkalibacillus salilacus]MDQ0158931.1 membrane protein CcdC involved in cytochrome C biogenesis [Alkalibacillus salilacus]
MFSFLDHPLVATAITIMAMIMASGMIVVRQRASKKPASIKKILLPPLFMSTGALMFAFPYFRIEWLLVLEAITVGLLFSIVLILTSKFEIYDQDIYLKPSKALGIVLIGLLVIRVAWKLAVGESISVGETSSMFYLLAFAMLVTWRIGMLVKFMKLKATLS